MKIRRGTPEHRLACRNKRTKGQVESDKNFIAEPYSKGRNQREITEALNAARPYSLSRPIISVQIREILAEWTQHRLTERDTLLAEELLRLNRIEREAWSVWDKTKDEPRFLSIVRDCITERCKLFGLYATAKVQHAGADSEPLLIASLPAPVIHFTIEETPETKRRMALAYNDSG
jgi:hypothetical protein